MLKGMKFWIGHDFVTSSILLEAYPFLILLLYFFLSA